MSFQNLQKYAFSKTCVFLEDLKTKLDLLIFSTTPTSEILTVSSPMIRNQSFIKIR
jgi:hypothetical protein